MSSDGGSPVLSKGIVWSTNPNPTIELLTLTSDGAGTGSAVGIMKPLLLGTKYYVRAYATNALGTAYGNELSFTTLTKSVCRLDRWVYGKYDCCTDMSFLFHYNTANQPDNVEQQIASGSGWSPGIIYKHVYKGDSTYVYVSSVAPSNLNVTVASGGNGVTSIKRYFPTTGGTYRYSFDYSIANRVTINLDYIGNYGSYTERIQTGIYYFDGKGNVIRFERSMFDYTGVRTFYQDTSYTYDQSENPVKGLIVPFFESQGVPPVAYFSASNKISETSNGVTTTFGIQYATTGLPNQYGYLIYGSMGVPSVVNGKYTYINCSN